MWVNAIELIYMRRIIKQNLSIFLSVLMLINFSHAEVFAQQVNYAFPFQYDNFTLGKTDENEFIAKLKQDIADNPLDFSSAPSNPYSKNESSIQKAYNNFLYYSRYPQRSPYWKWTAFEPDKTAKEDDVLFILQKHKEISQEIEKLLKQNPEYKHKLADKRAIFATGGLMLSAMSFALWEIVPVGIAAGNASAATVGFGTKIAKAAKFMTIFGIDVLSTDYIAFSLRNLEGIKENINDVDIYKSALINNVENRNILKSQIENKHIQICSEAIENFHNMRTAYVATNGRAPVINEMRKWEPIVHFCNGSKRDIGDKQFRIDLGQYLLFAYNKTEAPEENIEYARQEMVALYHALLFIKEELSDETDRLRFDRAFLDIVTTYKIAQITIRNISFFGNKEPAIMFQADLLQEKGLTAEDLNGSDLESHYSTYLSYPLLLPRTQLNYIVQRIDIEKQKRQLEMDKKWEKSWNDYMKQHPFGLPK